MKDRQGSNDEAHRRFQIWREKAQSGSLTLGGFASAASQLPLLLLRKQSLVKKLYDAKQSSNAGQRPVGIDAADIGIVGGKTQWKLFYDTDDLSASRAEAFTRCLTVARTPRSWTSR